MKKKSGQQKKVLRDLQKFVDNNAGGDTEGLFNSFFNTRKNQKKNLSQNLILQNDKVNGLISGLRNACNSSPAKGKKQFLSLMRAAGFTQREVQEFGFSCSFDAWKTAGNFNKNHTPGSYIPSNGGRQKTDPLILKDISDFALSKENCRPSPNRTVKVGKGKGNKEDVPVSYLNTSVSEAYHKWRRQRTQAKAKVVSEPVFRAHLKTIKELKKAKKATDMCAICVTGKKVEAELNKMRRRLIKSSLKKRFEKLKQLNKNYQQHKHDQEHQRKKFNQTIKGLKPNRGVVVLDFKSNVIINQNPTHEIGKDFYDNPQRSCFGIVLYYNNGQGVQKHYFDNFSNSTDHNSSFVISAIKKLLSDPFFIGLELKFLHFWMDNGPVHFRTKELFHFFYHFKKNFQISTKWNFFVEGHGKSCCDRRFSRISSMVKNYVNNPDNPIIKSVGDLVKAIRSEQINCNERRQFKGKDKISSTQVNLDVPESTHFLALKISNFKKGYYSFYKKDDKLVASFLTGGPVVKEWEPKAANVKRKEKEDKEGHAVPSEIEGENALMKLSQFFSLRDDVEVIQETTLSETDQQTQEILSQMEGIHTRSRVREARREAEARIDHSQSTSSTNQNNTSDSIPQENESDYEYNVLMSARPQVQHEDDDEIELKRRKHKRRSPPNQPQAHHNNTQDGFETHDDDITVEYDREEDLQVQTIEDDSDLESTQQNMRSHTISEELETVYTAEIVSSSDAQSNPLIENQSNQHVKKRPREDPEPPEQMKKKARKTVQSVKKNRNKRKREGENLETKGKKRARKATTQAEIVPDAQINSHEDAATTRSRKRKRVFDPSDESSTAKKRKVEAKVPDMKFSSGYKYYENISEETLHEVQKVDKTYHISSFLSSDITREFMIRKHFPRNPDLPDCSVQLVKVSSLVPFVEADRTQVSKNPDLPPDVAMEESHGSILQRGFLEPAILQFSYGDHTARLTEGNTRLAFARTHDIEYIPIRVVPLNAPLEGVEVQGIIPHKQWLVASDLHFPTVKDTGHPYFPPQVEKKVFRDVDPRLWFDKSVDVTEDELVVAFDQLLNLGSE